MPEEGNDDDHGNDDDARGSGAFRDSHDHDVDDDEHHGRGGPDAVGSVALSQRPGFAGAGRRLPAPFFCVEACQDRALLWMSSSERNDWTAGSSAADNGVIVPAEPGAPSQAASPTLGALAALPCSGFRRSGVVRSAPAIVYCLPSPVYRALRARSGARRSSGTIAIRFLTPVSDSVRRRGVSLTSWRKEASSGEGSSCR